MSVKEYCLKFTQVTIFSLKLLPYSRAHMNKFVIGVSDLVVNECRTTILIKDMDIAQFMSHA